MAVAARVAVDLDDVLADLITYLVATHCRLTGQPLTREEASDWSVFPTEVHDAARGGGYDELQPLAGAREFLAWLRPQTEICIVTYRDERAREMTLAWLARHVDGLFDRVCFTGGSKVEACRELGVSLIIDDSSRQVPAVTAALGIPGILMETPMNRHVSATPLIHRARDLGEARAIMTARLGYRSA